MKDNIIRGAVHWVSFDPSLGGEIKKVRPAVIVSNDAANKYLNRLQVIPISTQTQNIYPCETQLFIKGKVCKAMADQLMTISKKRLRGFIQYLHQEELRRIEYIIKLQLELV